MSSVPRFFVPGCSDNALLGLQGVAAHHARNVLRVRVGDAVCVFDAGREFRATVLSASRDEVALNREEEIVQHRECPLDLHLITSPLKGDLTEQVVRQATELGVNRMTLAGFIRTDVNMKGAAGRLERWLKVAISAAEQCGRCVVPAIDTRPTLDEALSSLPALDAREKRLTACEPSLGRSLSKSATPQAVTRPSRVRIVVGPAGGLDAAELELLRASHFGTLDLGARTLRSETASISAIATAIALFGDAAID